jgi:hypothetical protein
MKLLTDWLREHGVAPQADYDDVVVTLKFDSQRVFQGGGYTLASGVEIPSFSVPCHEVLVVMAPEETKKDFHDLKFVTLCGWWVGQEGKTRYRRLEQLVYNVPKTAIKEIVE